jgi:hypothetical protein
MIMVHARLLFLSLGDKSALDSDCINIGPVLGFPPEDVKVPVGADGYPYKDIPAVRIICIRGKSDNYFPKLQTHLL